MDTEKTDLGDLETSREKIYTELVTTRLTVPSFVKLKEIAKSRSTEGRKITVTSLVRFIIESFLKNYKG